MRPEHLIGIAALLALVAGPLLLGLAGLQRAHRISGSEVRKAARPWDWKLTIASALLYALAFNLTFFIQELFLVVPKALTPGLLPILFHNNHTWAGENPLARLFQGTGALAIFITGVICVLLLNQLPARSAGVRLFLIWMAYNGLLQSLPQVAIGSVEPQNDVGMAMDYLHFSVAGKMAAALVALIAIAIAALTLRRPLLSVAQDMGDIGDSRTRTAFMFRVATLPALAAILLIIPFRVPRNWVEVAAVPVVVTVIGIAWLQAGAWAVSGAKASGAPETLGSNALGSNALGSKTVGYAFGALLLLLLVFQLLLRRGVRFY
jgi:hypothetical protein